MLCVPLWVNGLPLPGIDLYCFNNKLCNPKKEVEVFNFGKPTPKKFDLHDPIPTGEVTEGNEEADWAAWEDSVRFRTA